MPVCETGLNGDDCTGHGVHGEVTRIKCYACGKPACRPCSSIVLNWRRKGLRVRMCADCQEDNRDDFASGKLKRDRLPSGITLPKTAEQLIGGKWYLPGEET